MPRPIALPSLALAHPPQPLGVEGVEEAHLHIGAHFHLTFIRIRRRRRRVGPLDDSFDAVRHCGAFFLSFCLFFSLSFFLESTGSNWFCSTLTGFVPGFTGFLLGFRWLQRIELALTGLCRVKLWFGFTLFPSKFDLFLYLVLPSFT